MSDKTTEPVGAKELEVMPKESQTFSQWALGWAKSIAIAFVIWFFLQAFLLKSFMIISDSLEPTLHVGDALFVNKALYGARVPFTNIRTPAIREPRDGELVVFKGIEEPVLTIVKRLIGVPGDTVEMRKDSLFRNGVLVPEPYVRHVNPAVNMDHAQRLRSTMPKAKRLKNIGITQTRFSIFPSKGANFFSFLRRVGLIIDC